MARVLRVTANLKEAISKSEVLAHRNLIKGSKERVTEQWIGNAQISTVTPRVNQAERRESLISYPERSCKMHQKCSLSSDVHIYFTRSQQKTYCYGFEQPIGRSESFNIRSSQFKICFMAQQQAITYQYDLFNQVGQDVMRPFGNSEAVCGAEPTKALQVKEARGQGREP